MLRPLELAPVERQPAGIARLRAPDDQKILTRQGVVGEPDVHDVELAGDGELEVGAARRRRMRDDRGRAPGLGARGTSR